MAFVSPLTAVVSDELTAHAVSDGLEELAPPHPAADGEVVGIVDGGAAGEIVGETAGDTVGEVAGVADGDADGEDDAVADAVTASAGVRVGVLVEDAVPTGEGVTGDGDGVSGGAVTSGDGEAVGDGVAIAGGLAAADGDRSAGVALVEGAGVFVPDTAITVATVGADGDVPAGGVAVAATTAVPVRGGSVVEAADGGAVGGGAPGVGLFAADGDEAGIGGDELLAAVTAVTGLTAAPGVVAPARAVVLFFPSCPVAEPRGVTFLPSFVPCPSFGPVIGWPSG